MIVGHVDSVDGPAVFHGLPLLEAGDEIVVHRADDTEVRFTVERVERWPKDAFPTDEVYRHAEAAELRLITCGGRFDRPSLRYLDNVIVFAREVTGDPRAPCAAVPAARNRSRCGPPELDRGPRAHIPGVLPHGPEQAGPREVLGEPTPLTGRHTRHEPGRRPPEGGAHERPTATAGRSRCHPTP